MKCIKGFANQGFHPAVVRCSRSAILTGLIETLLGTIPNDSPKRLPQAFLREKQKGKIPDIDALSA